MSGNHLIHTALGVDLIRKLSAAGDRIFTSGRARELALSVGLSESYLHQALHHLTKSGWIMRLRLQEERTMCDAVNMAARLLAVNWKNNKSGPFLPERRVEDLYFARISTLALLLSSPIQASRVNPFSCAPLATSLAIRRSFSIRFSKTAGVIA